MRTINKVALLAAALTAAAGAPMIPSGERAPRPSFRQRLGDRSLPRADIPKAQRLDIERHNAAVEEKRRQRIVRRLTAREGVPG